MITASEVRDAIVYAYSGRKLSAASQLAEAEAAFACREGAYHAVFEGCARGHKKRIHHPYLRIFLRSEIWRIRLE